MRQKIGDFLFGLLPLFLILILLAAAVGIRIVAWKYGYPIAVFLSILCIPIWLRVGPPPFPGMLNGMFCLGGCLWFIIHAVLLCVEWLRLAIR
jgi:hypothetical protein